MRCEANTRDEPHAGEGVGVRTFARPGVGRLASCLKQCCDVGRAAFASA